MRRPKFVDFLASSCRFEEKKHWRKRTAKRQKGVISRRSQPSEHRRDLESISIDAAELFA
jgi:hypothetical protein